jgi:hypothetical protein
MYELLALIDNTKIRYNHEHKKVWVTKGASMWETINRPTTSWLSARAHRPTNPHTVTKDTFKKPRGVSCVTSRFVTYIRDSLDQMLRRLLTFDLRHVTKHRWKLGTHLFVMTVKSEIWTVWMMFQFIIVITVLDLRFKVLCSGYVGCLMAFGRVMAFRMNTSHVSELSFYNYNIFLANLKRFSNISFWSITIRKNMILYFD